MYQNVLLYVPFKGLLEFPLNDRAKQICAFVMPHGLYQYWVMCFGMKNALATFQWMINQIIGRMESCDSYIDDVVVYSDSWKNYLSHLHNVLTDFANVNFTINVAKSEFVHAEITFYGTYSC